MSSNGWATAVAVLLAVGLLLWAVLGGEAPETQEPTSDSSTSTDPRSAEPAPAPDPEPEPPAPDPIDRVALGKALRDLTHADPYVREEARDRVAAIVPDLDADVKEALHRLARDPLDVEPLREVFRSDPPTVLQLVLERTIRSAAEFRLRLCTALCFEHEAPPEAIAYLLTRAVYDPNAGVRERATEGIAFDPAIHRAFVAAEDREALLLSPSRGGLLEGLDAQEGMRLFAALGWALKSESASGRSLDRESLYVFALEQARDGTQLKRAWASLRSADPPIDTRAATRILFERFELTTVEGIRAALDTGLHDVACYAAVVEAMTTAVPDLLAHATSSDGSGAPWRSACALALRFDAVEARRLVVARLRDAFDAMHLVGPRSELLRRMSDFGPQPEGWDWLRAVVEETTETEDAVRLLMLVAYAWPAERSTVGPWATEAAKRLRESGRMQRVQKKKLLTALETFASDRRETADDLDAGAALAGALDAWAAR